MKDALAPWTDPDPDRSNSVRRVGVQSEDWAEQVKQMVNQMLSG